jgi:hypothetical protein
MGSVSAIWMRWLTAGYGRASVSLAGIAVHGKRSAGRWGPHVSSSHGVPAEGEKGLARADGRIGAGAGTSTGTSTSTSTSTR